jgi:retron-type reverse transcriptase/5-methylcytosine-specific restriction endonuclease McrA
VGQGANLAAPPDSLVQRQVAVRRVTENQGKRTPGVDKVVWDTPEKKAQAVRDLRRWGYRPLPLRRVLIPKSNGQTRPLGIPAMRDRAMQALYLLALDPVAETVADPNSYGFRKARSCADAIEQCFTALCHAHPQWVLEGDIKGCFDHLSHEWLLADVPTDKAVLRKWLKSGYMAGQVLYETEDGTPQGGVISPVLANLALDGLERRLREQYPAKGKGSERGRLAGVHLIRYADDFIITGRTKELLEGEVRPLVESFGRVLWSSPFLPSEGWNYRKRRQPSRTSRRASTSSGSTCASTRTGSCSSSRRRRVSRASWTACKAWLYHAASTPIRRHVKVRGEANPYDPRWEEYFEKREGVKMLSNLRGVRQLRYLWHEQNGLCPVCEQKITKLTGWHNHHLVYRVMGGSDSAENRVLLHPECHRSVHSQGVFVEKPRPVKGV